MASSGGLGRCRVASRVVCGGLVTVFWLQKNWNLKTLGLLGRLTVEFNEPKWSYSEEARDGRYVPPSEDWDVS